MEDIHSSEEINIGEHFKVSAGPGAGKTYWLLTHIKNVLHNSTQLSKTANIACITFTNTGVEAIQGGLEDSAGRVVVSTIHSFLYTNIVRPYGFLLKDQDGKYLINLYKLDGHDEHIPSLNIIYKWKANTRQQYLNEDKIIWQCLKDLDWQFNEDGELVLIPRAFWKMRINSRYSIRKDSLIEYKKLYWNRGQIHHEDVLYFSYRLITEHSEILKFISLKYPYIFIDEFQDTHPIQTAIIKKISERDTIVGVIGDAAQSIYKFQGASRQDFIDFSLPGIKQYYIKGNRRSTNKIIKLLNKIRGDAIEQSCIRNIEGDNINLLIGDKFKSIDSLTQKLGEIAILARNNNIVGQIKNSGFDNVGNLWDISITLDSNYQRQELIYSIIYAVELTFSGNYQEARKKVSKLFRFNALSGHKMREYSISLIQEIIDKRAEYLNKTITCFNNSIYNIVKTNFKIKIGAKIKRGAYKTGFADKYTYSDLEQSLRIQDDHGLIRTIHKAKGAQFKNVLVVLESESELEDIIKPDMRAEKDDSRIYYVALSRARDNLYLTIPEVSEANKALINDILNIEIVE